MLVLNDQSSPSFMSPDTSCIGCTTVQNFFDYTQSASFVLTNSSAIMNTTYWNASGVTGNDTVCFGDPTGFCMPSPLFLVDDYSSLFADIEYANWASSYEGTLAFGRPSNASDPASTSFLSLAL
jgi:hypothetical protein